MYMWFRETKAPSRSLDNPLLSPVKTREQPANACVHLVSCLQPELACMFFNFSCTEWPVPVGKQHPHALRGLKHRIIPRDPLTHVHAPLLTLLTCSRFSRSFKVYNTNRPAHWECNECSNKKDICIAKDTCTKVWAPWESRRLPPSSFV